MPDIGQMARRAAGRKEDDVYSHVVARFRQIMPQDFGGGRHARQTPLVDRQVQLDYTEIKAPFSAIVVDRNILDRFIYRLHSSVSIAAARQNAR